MNVPKYRVGDQVKALRDVDGDLILAAAFVVVGNADGGDRVKVEFLADGNTIELWSSGIRDRLVPHWFES